MYWYLDSNDRWNLRRISLPGDQNFSCARRIRNKRYAELRRGGVAVHIAFVRLFGEHAVSGGLRARSLRGKRHSKQTHQLCLHCRNICAVRFGDGLGGHRVFDKKPGSDQIVHYRSCRQNGAKINYLGRFIVYGIANDTCRCRNFIRRSGWLFYD